MNTGVTVKMSKGFQGTQTLTYHDPLKNNSCENLKTWVSLKTGHPGYAQRLIFAGKLLGDNPNPNISLHDQNVRDGSTIYVVNNLGDDDRIKWECARKLQQKHPEISWKDAKIMASGRTEEKYEVPQQETYIQINNRCIVCNCDMGQDLSQLCGTTKCHLEGTGYGIDFEERTIPG